MGSVQQIPVRLPKIETSTIAKNGSCVQIQTVSLEQLEQLAELTDLWEVLVREALEPNVYQEPWFLLPALRSFAEKAEKAEKTEITEKTKKNVTAHRDLVLLLISGPAPCQPAGRPVLYGLFVLQRKRLARLVPFHVWESWRHPYAALDTPLIRADSANACLEGLFSWLASSQPRASLVELGPLRWDGPFACALHDFQRQHGLPTFVLDVHSRALYEPKASADDFLEQALTGKRRKEFRRQERLLGERLEGIEYRFLRANEDACPWIEEFLKLESAGWKGREGTALASQVKDTHFFRSVTRAAHERQQLQFLGLFSTKSNQALALKCNFLTSTKTAGYAFKIAFAEEYDRYSPGVLLELETIRAFQNLRELAWVDSCAIPNHPMIDRLWPGRRAIQTLLLPTGQGAGGFLVSTLPLVRWCKRKLKSLLPRIVTTPDHPSAHHSSRNPSHNLRKAQEDPLR